MEFRFTEEQQMTAEAVRGLFADHCQPADLRRLMETGAARDPERWRQIVRMELHGALVVTDKGGLGLGAADFVQIAEACGEACLPEPLVENAGVAVPLLAAIANDPRADNTLAAALAGDITIALSHPANLFAVDADTAGAILHVAGDAVHLLDPATLEMTRQPGIDPFRRLFHIAGPFPGSTAIATTGEAQPFLGAALDRGATFTAAQLVGIAQRAVDLAVAYAKERQQFGKPIGAYQAVKHLLATAQVKIEFARPLVYAAAAQLHQADLYSRARISHARIAASQAADLACRTAVQVHGAMGYSWEVDVHFFLKRALALSNWWGDLSFHRQRVEERVFSHPLGADRTFASEVAHA